MKHHLPVADSQKQKPCKIVLFQLISGGFIWLLLITGFISVTNSAWSQCFNPAINYPVSGEHTSAAVGDFNGDGRLDLVNSINYNQNQLEIRLANEIGGFGSRQSYDLEGGTLVYSVAISDINLDGKLDIAAACYNTSSVAILLGDGRGKFGAPTYFNTGQYFGTFTSVTIADFNKDGKPDLAMASKGNLVVLLEGDGVGNFRYLTSISFGDVSLEARSVAAGDFNADGHIDLGVVFYNSIWVSIHLGNGSGGFGTATKYFVGSAPSSLAVADFNGDGKLDLAVSLYFANSISMLVGNGLGGFRSPASIPAGSNMNALAVNDLNSDGRPDLVLTNMYSSIAKLINCTGVSNTAPEAVANPLQIATLGTPFSYTVNAFFDKETPNNLTYSANIDLASGLIFNPVTRIISGTPTISGVNSVSITATDPGNLSATVSVLISVCTPSADYAALVDLYKSTNGDDWYYNDNWLIGCSPCGWYGVGCDEQGRVTSLSLRTNRLTGSLPASLGDLTHLKVLNLSRNALRGTLPASLGNLTQLETLNLTNNLLRSSIPTSLGEAASLKELLLSANSLIGSIPASLSKLTNLTFLDLTSNPLVGIIPPGIGNLTQLEKLHLSDCLLTGDIPASLGNLSTIKELYLANNMLSGCIPASFTAFCGEGKTITLYNNAGLPGLGDLAAFCKDGSGRCAPINTAPVAVANVDQAATVGSAFSYTVNTFTDAETPNHLTYTATIEPANSFVFDPLTRKISGTPITSTTSSVTITATDPGGLSASTSFSITASPASTTGLSIAGVTGVNCLTLSAYQRQLIFTPQYSGQSAGPISFWVANEMMPATAPGPYSLQLYTDNPTITLMAQQGGAPVSYRYDWLVSCGTTPRPPTGFAITGVTSVSCQTVSASEHLVSFTPQYRSQSSEPISFSVVNELMATTAVGPYSLRVYADNPVVTLWAQQGNESATYRYDWLGGCNGGARKGVELSDLFHIIVLGNPVTDHVEIEVYGADQQPLSLQVISEQGQRQSQLHIQQARAVERHRLTVGHQAGVYLLLVTTPTQRKTLKLVKH